MSATRSGYQVNMSTVARARLGFVAAVVGELRYELPAMIRRYGAQVAELALELVFALMDLIILATYLALLPISVPLVAWYRRQRARREMEEDGASWRDHVDMGSPTALRLETRFRRP